MPPDKNPCLECELLHQDKDNPTCENCEKRIEYLVALGHIVSKVPIESIDLPAKKGVKMRAHAEKSQKAQMESERICEECRENSTLHPNSKLCASCMAKRSHKNKKRPGSAFKAGKKKKAYTDQPKSEVAPKEPGHAVTIEFKSHVSVLKEVEKLADREMRPLDCQILYMLKCQIESTTRGETAR